MRFQDAAPDARAVVYAGIQADPLVARAGELLAHASLEQRILARAVMNGETTDADAWRAMFPTLFGADADAASREVSEGILAAALSVAERGEQVRSQFRGAIVEVTDRSGSSAPATPAARRPRSGASAGSSSTASPPRSTRTTSRSRWTGPRSRSTASGAPAASPPTSSTSSTTPGATPRTTTSGSGVVLVVFDAARSCAVRLDRQTAPHDETRVVAIEDLDELASPTGATR